MQNYPYSIPQYMYYVEYACHTEVLRTGFRVEMLQVGVLFPPACMQYSFLAC